MDLLFVTGTGTGVGKTVVTAGLAACLLRKGRKVGVAKPVESGVVPGAVSDLDLVRTVCRNLALSPMVRRGPYSFSDAVSPHLAAQLADDRIDCGRIVAFIDEFRSTGGVDTLLVEGVGGVCVPLNEDALVLDLVKLLGASTIVVAGVSLGTINHSLLTIRTLRNAGVEIRGVVFNQMPSEPGEMEFDNIETIRRLGKVDVIGVVPKIDAAVDSREFAVELLVSLSTAHGSSKMRNIFVNSQ